MPGTAGWAKFQLGLFIIISALGYMIMGYFVQRSDHFLLFNTYILLFIGYLWICYQAHNYENIVLWILMAIGFRCLFLGSMPALSDDFYRFIWDGRLLNLGISPFEKLPEYYISEDAGLPGLDLSLFNSLNSPRYFTIYPPVSQFTYWLSVVIFPDSIRGSVLVMRIFIILAEIGSLLLIHRLLKIYHQPASRLLLYAFNPLVIIELSGNLHGEALMIFFLLLGLWLFKKRHITLSAIAWGFAIASKLLPLIFMPLFICRLSFGKMIRFYSLVGLTVILLFIPLLNQSLFTGLSASLSLYFQKFEFNASVYYIIREIGFALKGYNIIATAGKGLAVAAFLLILGFAYLDWHRKYSLPFSFLWLLWIYFALATIVHPWYITSLVAFALFTTFRFPMLWSFLIFFTYGNYKVWGYKENLWWVIIEYIVLFLCIGWEIYLNRKRHAMALN
ncbi:MAG: hypothetical protein ACNS62_13380 [Candidatus Cyclobacteriaceae bacterium M3_2C_046]